MAKVVSGDDQQHHDDGEQAPDEVSKHCARPGGGRAATRLRGSRTAARGHHLPFGPIGWRRCG